MGANDGVKYKKKLLNKVKTEQDRIKQEKQRMSTKSEEEEHKQSQRAVFHISIYYKKTGDSRWWHER